VSGGPRGERPSKQFLNLNLNFIKFKKQKTHAFLPNMGNTKYEHAVVTAHQINNQEVTTDTPLPLFDQFIEDPSTSIARANDFNNTLLTTVDDFFFPQLFEFENLEPSSQDSVQSNFSPNNFTK
jgi:hypothetical protein